MKRLFKVMLISLIAISLVACGSKDNSSNDGDVTEVVFWHSAQGAIGTSLEKVIEEYNNGRGKEKNIKVNLVFQGYEGTDKVILAYQTNDVKNAPDINQGLTSTIPQMLELDWTVKASDYFKKEGSEITENTFYEGLQRATTYQGEMSAVPFANSTLLLYYNVDMLNDAGFDNPPATMDELIKYTETLTKKNDAGEVVVNGLNMQMKRYQLVNFIVSQSAESFFGDNEGGRTAPMTKLTIDEDGTLRKALEKFDALNKTGGYKFIEESINEEFAQGLSAMTIMSSSRISTIQELVGDNFEFMTAPIPKVNESDTSGASAGGGALILFDRGDQTRLDASWDVLEYLSSAEVQAEFSAGTGYIPVNKESENLDSMKTYYTENPQYKVAVDQLKNSNPMSQEPFDLVYGEMDSIITNVMLEFFEGTLTIDETIDKLVSECNKVLDEYHRANG